MREFHADDAPAKLALAHAIVNFSAASKENDEVDLRHSLGTVSDVLLGVDEPVELKLRIEMVCHTDLAASYNHAMTRKGLDGQDFLLGVVVAILFDLVQVENVVLI